MKTPAVRRVPFGRVLLALSVAATMMAGTPAARAGDDLWSLKKPVRPKVPAVRQAERVRNPIDAFVLAALERQGLAPAPQADRRTLVRRAYFDLLGLPPTPEQVEKFTADQAPDAWQKLIDELLQSPRYGERWARHWLDVARYADSGGYETDIYFRNAWRYRDWVVKSLNDDKPYDRFVQEQVAGDELWPDNLDLNGNYVIAPEKLAHLEARVGTGLFALGPQIHESNMDAPKLAYERLTDWVDTAGSVFLGLTLGCARCHDHKFDPLSQRDYYGLQAAFAGSKEVDMPLINAMEIADFKQHYPRVIAVDEARKAYRLFEKKIAGRAATPAEEEERRKLLDAIAQAVLAVPEAASSTPNDRWDGIFEVPTATVLGHELPELIPAVHVLTRGDHRKPKDKVEPALPAVLAEATGASPALPGPFGSRKELAMWLTRPDHPLTARVMVNRVWLWHFGRGIVATPNDFGNMGQPPSHPELLDWLATEFVREGWSLKKLHRLIMLSDAYQRDSRFATPAHLQADPDNRLLWRMSRRRLEAEALWDAVHAAAGTLTHKLGGRPVVPVVADDEITALRDRWQWPVSVDPAERTRRGLYVLVRRNFRFPMFEVFDAPVNSVSCPARDVTTVAPQALWFMNNATTFRQAQEFAGRLVKDAGDDPSAQINRAWQIALGRLPSDLERGEALALLDALNADPAGKPLDNPPEALSKLPPPRAAALTKLCLGVMNLNEFVFVD